MDKMKDKVLEELIEHLGEIQGGRLKDILKEHPMLPKESKPEMMGEGERHVGSDAFKNETVKMNSDPGKEEISKDIGKEESEESPQSSEKQEMSEEDYEELRKMFS